MLVLWASAVDVYALGMQLQPPRAHAVPVAAHMCGQQQQQQHMLLSPALAHRPSIWCSSEGTLLITWAAAHLASVGASRSN